MMLPTISTPKYFTTLPVMQKDVEYRPFLVKEEKVLLIALQDQNQKNIFQAIRALVRDCTFGAIDISKLSQVDAEWIFLQIRNKSMGESVEVSVKCPHCGNKNFHELNMEAVMVEHTDEKINTKIELAPNVIITVRYPSIENFFTGRDNENITVAECIETFYIDGQLYDAKDISLEERVQFVENLPKPQAKLLNEFFQTAPKMVYRDEMVCLSCMKTVQVRLEGLDDFFG